MEIISPRDKRLNKQNFDSFKKVSYWIEDDLLSDVVLDFIKKEIDNIPGIYIPSIETDLHLKQYNIEGNFHTAPILPTSSLFKISEFITEKISDINNNIFQFDISHREYAIVNSYSNNQTIGWHKDESFFSTNPEKADNRLYRKLIGIYNIDSAENYSGGDFQIRTLDDKPESCLHNIRPKVNSLIVFPSLLTHRVAPVISGIRRTIVIRMDGPRWR